MAAAWAIVERDGAVLFVQRSARTSRPGQWCLPGGRIHGGEDSGDAALRELREETGLVGTLGNLAHDTPKQFYYQCHVDGDQQVSLKANECQDHRWVAPADLLSLGHIMELRRVVLALRVLGFEIHLPPGLEHYVQRGGRR
ncbi:MAG: NUDIX hydrolase [Bradymonadia bacterium]